uniref:Dipeptidyl-peptidase VI n=1 Tax=uncultured bacterium Contig39 TaxID=1393565 RepID=W0FKL5_9BACT|nr:dipeptidyl-peptidase VI [uncultured bacterium Contig39]
MKRILLLSVLALWTLGAAAQSWDGPQWAVVNSSSCFLRLKPDYESGNETQCLMGTVLRVKGAERYWRQVDAPDYKDVWTTELNIAFMDEAGKDAWIAAPKFICSAEYTHLYATPSMNADRVCDFTLGDLVRKGTQGIRGWVQVYLPSGREAWARAYDVMDFGEWVRTREATRENLLATARRLVGTPYMWGGASIKHFDCSGFTQFVYRQCGIVLPRNAREQIYTGEEVPYDFDKMLPGDLLFYGTPASPGKRMVVAHVAMYYGDRKIIHSSQVVRISSLTPDGEDFYDRQPLSVRRILGHVDDGSGIRSVATRPWYY